MKYCLAFLLLISHSAFTQVDTTELSKAVQQLDRALLGKDTIVLHQLLADKVTFGHSNGWIQSKADVIKDLASGKLVYEAINRSNVSYSGTSKWKSVRMNVAVNGRLNEKAFTMQLHVLQVWLKHKRNWKLVARQSAKIN